MRSTFLSALAAALLLAAEAAGGDRLEPVGPEVRQRPERLAPQAGPRPELYAPPPETPTGEEMLRAWRYRDALGAEIWRQERQIGPDNPRTLYPLQGLKNERQRMNGALRRP